MQFLSDLRPVIGATIPEELACRLGLDLNYAQIQKDGKEGSVMVSGRCNGGWKDSLVPIEEIHLKADQKERLDINK